MSSQVTPHYNLFFTYVRVQLIYMQVTYFTEHGPLRLYFDSTSTGTFK